MAWETRRGRKYAYQSYRDRLGKVRRRYLGRGPAAVLLATRLLERRQARAARRALAVQEQRRDASLVAMDDMVRDLMAAQLLTTGFHQHAGIWRRRRIPRPGSNPAPTVVTPTAPSPSVPPNETAAADALLPLRGLLEQARRDDLTSLPTLRQVLDGTPGVLAAGYGSRPFHQFDRLSKRSPKATHSRPRRWSPIWKRCGGSTATIRH